MSDAAPHDHIRIEGCYRCVGPDGEPLPLPQDLRADLARLRQERDAMKRVVDEVRQILESVDHGVGWPDLVHVIAMFDGGGHVCEVFEEDGSCSSCGQFAVLDGAEGGAGKEG